MLLIVPLELGGVLGMPSTIVDGIRDGTGIYTGLGRGSGVLVSGRWDSPGQLLRGSGTVLGFTPWWVRWVGSLELSPLSICVNMCF